MNAKIAILFMIMIFTSGCYNMTNKLYDYNSPEIKTNNIIVKSQMVGTFKSYDKLATKGTPYELIINSECINNDCKVMEISNIKLINIAKNQVAYINKRTLKSEFTRFSDGKLNAQLSIKDIDIEYDDLMLEFDMSIKSNSHISNSVVRLTFKKAYKEYKSNSFWEKIMGV